MPRAMALAVLVGLLISAAGCEGESEQNAARITGGDPRQGRAAIERYGCGSCHIIPGVRGANGLVGPSLEHIASRAYLAGRLPNDVPTMVQWVRHPQRVEPGSAMPEMGVTEEDARNIAAWLYMLR